ncbi:discoidin domain-containing protein [Prolixibacteraceae bacterium Z1-6]|uniref:Discoidin domain-containing protein n=1 Tax=Draconibacterium aestuarii TaxID=2998507 RepID=A0A9X3F8E6_9BACT|nr:discoidin domain-containing protein [Prolixibacteraceae bacterium Z1-6]
MKPFLTLILLLSITLNTFPQTQYTPYDELPGIDKSYKPSFSNSFTGWKRMLYEYPVDFKRIQADFKTYRQNNSNEKSAIIRYYKIWNRVISEYVTPNGTIIIPDTDEISSKQFSLQKNSDINQKSAALNGSDWTFLGPKETFWRNEDGMSSDRLDGSGFPKQCPWQANVYSFDAANNHPSILYCGTETGFVNKSIDKGENWNQVGLNYPFGGGVTAVAIHPENSDTVFVSAGKQIHKTTDGGESWTPLLHPDKTFNASRLRINPENSNIIAASADNGLYISNDGGLTWKQKWNKITYDIEFKPDNPSTVYGLSKNISGQYQVLKSINDGENFVTDTNFPTSYTESSGGLLAVTKADPGILFVTLLAKEGTEDVPFILKGSEVNGIFSWEEKKKGEYSSIGGLGGFTNGQGYFDLVLEVSPDDENLLFWGTCSLWKSVDGGTNFTKVGGYGGDFPIHPDIQDMKILDNGETWVATDGGMNYSSDYLSQTTNYSSKTKGIIGSDMWGFDQGWNEDIIVGGRYHNGNTAISDLYGNKALRMGGAESATGWVIKGKSRHVAFDDLGNGWILPKTAETKAEGRFIFSKFPNMDEYGGRRSNMVHHPNYYGTIFIGEGKAIWKSKDSGASFDLLFQFPDKIRYFQISQKNPDVLYADIINYGLYRSPDGGKSWTHKPALTNGSAGDSYWKGKLFFVISPYDENRIYACLQNGTWSADIGMIFKSDNGGNTWTNWTNGVEGYTKCMVIQPTKSEQDLVYLFTQSKNGTNSKVYLRYETQPYWNEFNTNYPAGKTVNLALPFYRDSKLRVSGNAGVWESPMAETDFAPVINPWIEKPFYDCMEDTLYFDDHSILNHSNANWEWEITPEPAYISSKNIRNPKVVLGNPGSYDVTVKVSQNGINYEKSISSMVSASTCPSVDDCNNPAEIDKSNWSLIYVDSEETSGEDGGAINAFDGDPATIWHTEWYYQSPGQPHEIQINLGEEYLVSNVKYLPRQNSSNGRIKEYEIYISSDKNQWGNPVISGEFAEDAGQKTITFAPTSGKYLKLKSLSEQNNNSFTSIAELDVTGCIQVDVTANNQIKIYDIEAYPIPAKDKLIISLPGSTNMQTWEYRFYSTSSSLIKSGSFTQTNDMHSLDISHFLSGTYILNLTNKNGQIFRVKLIKN